jgi:hypothetical protein
MPHQRGVLLVLRDDDGYSHGDRVPEDGLKLPAPRKTATRSFNLEQPDERRLVPLIERNDVEHAESATAAEEQFFSDLWKTHARNATWSVGQLAVR